MQSTQLKENRDFSVKGYKKMEDSNSTTKTFRTPKSAPINERSQEFERHKHQHHLMLESVHGVPMRTTVALDDDLIRIAQEFTGVAEKTALIREALKALIERESARRLASLGGTMPELKNIPRRRLGKN